MPDFSVDVRAWVDKAKQKAEAAFQATAQDAVNRVKQLTPVKTGYLRANWSAIKDGDAEPKPGMPAGDQAIKHAELGDKIIVVNPTAYARRIEYGFVGQDADGRHYNQPGRHMTQQTIAEMPRIAEQATQRVSSSS